MPLAAAAPLEYCPGPMVRRDRARDHAEGRRAGVSLDLVVFLAHNLAQLPRPVPRDLSRRRARFTRARCVVSPTASGARAGNRCSSSGRSSPTTWRRCSAARADAPVPAALTDTIAARSEGNPFFAEELLAAAASGERDLPRGLRDLLLPRVARLDRRTQGLLRLVAAAGRDVAYPLLARVVARRSARCASRCARPSSTASWSPSKRPAASASVTRCWPRRSTPRSCPASARSSTRGSPTSSRAAARATAAELAPHWAAAGRSDEALVASIPAARRGAGRLRPGGSARAPRAGARAVGGGAGRARARGARPRRAPRVGRRARQPNGRGPARGRPARRAIELVERNDPLRAALLYERLGRYLFESGSVDAALAAFERAVDLVPALPPSANRARALAGLGTGLLLAWRYDESLASASRRSSTRARSARTRPSSGHSRRSAATSRISAAATRASNSSGTPSERAEEIGNPLAGTGRMSLSPTS